MSTFESDAETAVTLLLVLPILVVWAFAIFDIVRREDLPVVRRVVYAAVVILVLPATLLYLLSRPTSIVRHRERRREDWRVDLMAQLEWRAGAPPVVGRAEQRQLLERVRRLDD